MRTIDLGGGVTEGVTHFKEELGAKPSRTFLMTKNYCNSLYLLLALVLNAGTRELIDESAFALSFLRDVAQRAKR